MHEDIHGPNMLMLGNNIRKRRVNLELTQQELAEMVNCSANHIGKIERAETQLSVEILYRLCIALNCTADQLFGSQFYIDTDSMSSDLHYITISLTGKQRSALLDMVKSLIPFVKDNF